MIFSSDKVRPDKKDPKSRLQEIVQQHLSVTPLYTVIDEQGKDHAKTFTICASVQGVTIGTGVGTNKKLAQEASALNALQNQPNWEHLLQAEIS